MTPKRRTTLWTTATLIAIALVGGGITAAVLADGSGERSAAEQIPLGELGGDTRLGPVELRAGDLDALIGFYGPLGVGLDVLEQTEEAVSLGRDGVELVRLAAAEGAPASPRDAGLFHTAIRFDDAPALARSLASVAGRYPMLYGGSADHAVSLAFYFDDPEGNGVELYVDTPRDEWEWQGGEVQMGSEPLDIRAFVDEHLGGASAGGASVGHVHLRVGDLERAEAFYADALGFAVTARVDGAIFLGAGGYHHHLAANTWGSAGAGARPAGLGLGSLQVVLESAAELDAVEARLADAGVASTRTADALVTADPWGTEVVLRAEG
ncbi:VOC family protein [Agrococcus sp. HG114]|uniref:VOC family protein n=1 Tax=Agrococcus sp. HG114 TaxID=2969757 RepID=UPI00215B22BE|nr:VOC family protein [Agrococcus sp. HG114]MCR8671263.1 VOC family protein [Agrococcus sp. HG114]